MHLHENDQVEGLLVQTRARIHPFKNHSFDILEFQEKQSFSSVQMNLLRKCMS